VPQVRQSVPGPKMFFFECFHSIGMRMSTRIGSALVELRPVFFVPGTLVRTWGTRPISWNVVGGQATTVPYLRQTLATCNAVGVSKTNYGPLARDQLLGGPPRRVSSPRLRPGSTLGLGLGAFFVSFLPLSLLPMEPNITRRRKP
jgi:hypothetical protein